MTRPKSPRQREREAVMSAWLLEQARKRRARGSRLAARVGGTTPLWVRAVVTREGDFLVTKCCIVADANVHPFEVRVDMRRLAGVLKKMMGEGRLPAALAADKVGGFGSFLKGIGKAITKNAVTKAVGKVVTSVVKSPIVQLANPMAAIAIHTTSRGLGGKGTIRGPAGKIVDLGAAVAAPVGLQHVAAHVAPKAIAALGLGAKTVMASKLGSSVQLAARQAQSVVKTGATAAAAINALKAKAGIDPKAALALKTNLPKLVPMVKAAVAVKVSAPKIAPALAAKVKTSNAAKRLLASVAAKAKAGNPDAKYTAAVVARTAKMTDEIARAQQAAGGGNPGFVITATGKVRKAPKGRFLQNSSVPVMETLYRGAATAPLRGSFSAVSGQRTVGGMHEYGPAWGGWDDPADQYDGPFLPVHHPHADDVVGGTPRHGWKGAPGTTAAARDRIKALLELARARHHIKTVLKRGRTTKVGNMSHVDIPGEMTEMSDGIPDAALKPELIGCAMPQVGASVMIGGLPWYVFTQRGLRHPVVRRRFLAGLKAMPPKMRRRVITRIKGLHLRERISGAVRNVTPNVGYGLQGYGWAGVSGCSQVAGPLTP